MFNQLILLSVGCPVLGAFLLPAFSRLSEKLRNAAALLLVLVPFVAAFFLIPEASVDKGRVFQFLSPIGSHLFVVDALSVFMAMVSSFIGSLIIVYSFGYISHYDNRDEYYLVVVLFLGSMMGLVYSANLIYIYVFWEVTAFCCWRLIGFFRGETHIFRADKAFLVTMAGSLIMLVGFLGVYHQTGSFDLAIIKERLNGIPISSFYVFLILFGILSKSATLPFHTWLPDAGVAPTPVTALLHAAVLVKIGVYVYARLFVATFPIEQFWHILIPILAGISALVSGCAALLENDIKRIIAYSTVSQIGFIFLGLSIGNEVALLGGLLYILMHGLSKAGLFLCAGIIEHASHTKDITKLGGLFSAMPVTAVSFLICAFSVMGIPPFGGFFSKYFVIIGAAKSGLGIACFFLFGAVLTMLYLMRVFNAIFMGETKMEGLHEGCPWMVGTVASLAFLSLAGGVFSQFPVDLVQTAVKQMLGAV
ncbi:MAG: NADH-quinone oxidoreductase subunit L [Candidatus Riflebacteria bacterium]|nr:NADH-quinone oxidoreductase subunit L [Candidatus Riflebacteria bacterium]